MKYPSDTWIIFTIEEYMEGIRYLSFVMNCPFTSRKKSSLSHGLPGTHNIPSKLIWKQVIRVTSQKSLLKWKDGKSSNIILKYRDHSGMS
jgi:hypothetical protein